MVRSVSTSALGRPSPRGAGLAPAANRLHAARFLWWVHACRRRRPRPRCLNGRMATPAAAAVLVGEEDDDVWGQHGAVGAAVKRGGAHGTRAIPTWTDAATEVG